MFGRFGITCQPRQSANEIGHIEGTAVSTDSGARIDGVFQAAVGYRDWRVLK